MNERDDKFADRWLDTSLDKYSDADPRPGFETRLLAALAAERAKQPRWRSLWKWAALGAAAAVLIAVVVLSVGRGRENKPNVIANTPAPTAVTPVPSVTHPPSNATANTGSPVVAQTTRPKRYTQRPPRSVQGNAAVLASAPRRPQFPTPSPLSEQERLMLAYVRATPPAEIENVVEQKLAFQKHVDSLGVPEVQEKSDR